jgi:hypothetical protein
LRIASENMPLWKCAKPEADSLAAVRVSTECLRGDAGRSLVVVDLPQHDAPRIPNVVAAGGIG